ncbi:unnamed protein product [Spirodela intermedia]|uniref:DEAD/DEAH-box helicase domain-containing protein n=1 Tax=Spirodela intermedia TaxID=51605 RepID=A0A7I8JFV5_SPIIN|nr:unnamed protein product [Spirodela intermedia]CAA6669027.1 unnamed protein product [Spirodela intermedia]
MPVRLLFPASVAFRNGSLLRRGYGAGRRSRSPRAISYHRLCRIKSLRPSAPQRVFTCGPDCASGAATAVVEALTLRDICQSRVPEHVLRSPRQSLPVLLSGKDCVLQAQVQGNTGVLIINIFCINPQRSAVQALVIVPTRELGMQVASVARMLAAKPTGFESVDETCTIMALLDGELVATLSQSMPDAMKKKCFKLDAIRVWLFDEMCRQQTCGKMKARWYAVLTQTEIAKAGIILCKRSNQRRAGNLPSALKETRRGDASGLRQDIAGEGLTLPETTHITTLTSQDRSLTISTTWREAEPSPMSSALVTASFPGRAVCAAEIENHLY